MWLVLLAAAFAGNAAELRILTVDEHRRPVTARLEVHGADGKMYQPSEGAIASLPPGRQPGPSPYLRSFVSKTAEVTLQVPEGRYRIVAERGLEYGRVIREISTSESPVEIRLRRWIVMRRKGWWAGDLHIHRPMADVPALLEAEDLDFGAVFTMWNRQNLWGDSPLPTDWIRPAGLNRAMSVTNAEDERGGGAWMLHGLREPLGIEKVLASPSERATESWNPPGIEFVRAARRQKQPGSLFPWFDLEKPIWWETPVMMALERPDSMGLLHNHYDQYGMYDNEAWGRKRDTGQYPGPSGFSDYSLQLMYRYWNLGWLVTPTAGAASGVLPNPVGYNRVYVKLDSGFDAGKWYEGLREGGRRVMVSNGPLVFFEPEFGGGRLMGKIEVRSRDPIERVEIIANGTVIASWKPGRPRFRSSVRARGIERFSWIAARAYARNEATVRLGHTAPVAVPGGRWDRRNDARYFREWVEDLARNPKTPRGSKAAALYDEALSVYRALEK